jgi:small-conductance mechanosensitive channel
MMLQLPTEFFGNSVRAWTTAGIIAGGVFLLLFFIKVFIGRRLTTMATRTTNDLDDVAAELVTKVRWYLIVALAVRSASVALQLPANIGTGIRQVAAIAVLLQLAVWGRALINFWVRKWGERRGTAAGASTLNAIGIAAKGLMWALIGVLALRNVLDYDISALLTGLGIGGIAIALAVQNVLGDLFAALSIVLDRPFEVGDTIAVDTFIGSVEHIGLKTTRVRAITGEQVIFANTDLLKSRVRNLKRQHDRRAFLTIGVTYETPPEIIAAIPSLLRECVQAHPGARFDRAHFVRFAESALEFELVYFVGNPDYALFMDAQQAVNIAILRAFNERKIDFAFPTRMIVERRADQGLVE